MFIINSSREVKTIMECVDSLKDYQKLQVFIPIFEQWSNNQINDKNEANPDLIDEEEIIIFNPSSIELDNVFGISLVGEIYLFLVQKYSIKASEIVSESFDMQLVHDREELQVLKKFERLSFKDKIDVVVEIILLLGNFKIKGAGNEIMDSKICFDIARKILDYKKEIFPYDEQESFPYDLKD